jgi:hypothetical protein
MGDLIADDSTLLKDLGLFIEPVEIYDTAGKLLGLFVPANLERAKQHYARHFEKTDWAEIERRSRSKEPGAPLHEILGRLKTLEAEMERRRQAGEREFTKEEALAFMKALREKAGASPAAGGVPNAGVPHALDRDHSTRGGE